MQHYWLKISHHIWSDSESQVRVFLFWLLKCVTKCLICFIRPHIDYGDIIYDQAYNISFDQKLEQLQYNACLAITGAIRGTSREKLYEELGLESLQLRRWFRKLSCFYKLFNSKNPCYLFKLIPSRIASYATRNMDNIPFFKTRHSFLKKTFFFKL